MKGSNILYVFLGIIIASTVGGFAIAEEYNIELNEFIGISSNQTNPLIETPLIETPIQEPIEQIELKDCSDLEILKKAWFKCEQFNRDIASDKLTQDRKDMNKEISRGF